MKTDFHYFKNIDSTNMEASREIAELDNNLLHIFYASQQDKGKGQGNHLWITEYEKNILMSIVVKNIEIPIENQFIISQATAICICEFIESEIRNCKVEIKWPNDIVINDKKVCGILIENNCIGKHISDTIIGIGLNLNQEYFSPDLPNANSLINIDNKTRNISESIDKIDKIFKKHLKSIQKKKYEKISSKYNKHLLGYNKIQEFTNGDSSFFAKIISCENDGKILLENSDGIVNGYYHHEIQMCYKK